MSLTGVVRDSHVPLFLQIEEEIRAMIEDGLFGRLTRLPSESELTARFSVSRMTVRKALDRLVSEGVLFRKPGKGTYVAPVRIEHEPSQAASFSTSVRSKGLHASTVVLAAAIVRPPLHIQRALDLRVGDTAAFVRRLRLVEDEPVAIHQTYLPSRYSDVLTQDLTGSLTDMLREGGARVASSRDSVEAIHADVANARLLGVKEGAPLLHLRGVAYGVDRRPLKCSEAHYRGDRFRFALRDSTVVPELHGVASDEGLTRADWP